MLWRIYTWNWYAIKPVCFLNDVWCVLVSSNGTQWLLTSWLRRVRASNERGQLIAIHLKLPLTLQSVVAHFKFHPIVKLLFWIHSHPSHSSEETFTPCPEPSDRQAPLAEHLAATIITLFILFARKQNQSYKDIYVRKKSPETVLQWEFKLLIKSLLICNHCICTVLSNNFYSSKKDIFPQKMTHLLLICFYYSTGRKRKTVSCSHGENQMSTERIVTIFIVIHLWVSPQF